MQENRTAAFAKFLGITPEKEIPKKKKQESIARQWVITEKPAEDGTGYTYKMVGYPVTLKASSKEEFVSLFCKRAKPLVEKTLGRKVSEIETEGIVRKLVRIETYNVKRPR
jgi:hypothetical protein